MTPEGKVKEDIKAVLDALPRCFYLMPVAGTMSKYGISDFLGLYRGWFFAIEAKRDVKHKPKLSQRIFLASVRRAGGFAKVIHAGNVVYLREMLIAHAARPPE